MIEGKNTNISESSSLGKNVSIRGDDITIEDGVVVGDNTKISARKIHIGYGTHIEENCNLLLGGDNSELHFGDHCFIGNDSKIHMPVFKTGDYVRLNNHLFANGLKACLLGHNIWVGQNCILNAYDELTIGNGVGIGTYSCIWTHARHGELLEGCTAFNVSPVNIEDDVWILGSYNVISPGVTLGKRAVVITGSVVTKNVLPNTTVAGNPAKDVTEKIPFYKEKVTLDEKLEMIDHFLNNLFEQDFDGEASKTKSGWKLSGGNAQGDIVLMPIAEDDNISINDEEQVIFTKRNDLQKNYENLTVFDLSSKTYTKRRTALEVMIIKSLLYEKARFLPV